MKLNTERTSRFINVAKQVAQINNISFEELKSHSRKFDFVRLRAMAFNILYMKHNAKLSEIGRLFQRHHSTIIHGLKTHNTFLETDESYLSDYMLTLAQVKEKNEITKAIEETNQFKKDLNQKQNVKKKTKKKKQDLGDKTQTPQQYTNKGVKGSFQEGIDQTIIGLKGKKLFSGTKSQQETKLKGLGLYDERILDIKNTIRLRGMAQKYIDFYEDRSNSIGV